MRIRILGAIALLLLARAAMGTEPPTDLIDQRTVRHKLWGIAFDLPLPNRICYAAPPYGLGRRVRVAVGPEADCEAPRSAANVDFRMYSSFFDIDDEDPVPPIRREIARRDCLKGFEALEGTLRDAMRIAGLPAFLCRTIWYNRDGAMRISTKYYAYRGFTTRGTPPSSLYPGVQYEFYVTTAPEFERDGVAILEQIVRSARLIPIEVRMWGKNSSLD